VRRDDGRQPHDGRASGGAGVLKIPGARWLLRLLPLLLALGVGGALRLELASLAPPFLVANDSADYFSAGFNLMSGGELVLSLKRTPLYALFLSGLTGIVGPSLDRVMAAQHAFGVLTIVLTYVLGHVAFGRVAAAVAAFAVAINGSLLTMEHLLISEVLFTPLLLASLIAVLAAVQQRRSWLWLLAGLLLGLDALCRPLGIGVLGAVLVMLPACRLPRRDLVRSVGLLILGTAVCLLPWMVRQARIHDQTVVNGGLGDALFSRVHRYDTMFTLSAGGPSGTTQDQAIRARIVELAPEYEYPREIRAVLRAEFGIDDVQADRALREVATNTIVRDPGRYVLGTLAMAARLTRGSAPTLADLWVSVQRERVIQGWSPDLRWVLATDRPTDDPAAFNRAQALLELFRDDLPGGLMPLAFAPLGAAWAVAAHRRTGTGVLPLVIITQIVLYVALDGPLFRYRFPLQPLITVLGSAGVQLVIHQIGVMSRSTHGYSPPREASHHAISSQGAPANSDF
jgi:hypothetical protein